MAQVFFLFDPRPSSAGGNARAKGSINPDSEVEAKFFAIAQNDNYLFVILNGANAQ
jgi:hypothetical protein